MKIGWWVLIGIVLIAVAAIICGALQPDATVTVITPEITTIRAYVEEQAVTELPHDHLIAMPIAGWLEPIPLREGDPVTRNQVVARLDTADLADRVNQAQQRIDVLETRLRRTADHRLEENALVETQATVEAIHETVAAAEAKLKAFDAVRDFALSELERIRGLIEQDSATEHELRRAQMEYRKAEAEYQSDVLELEALKTIEAVSHIGPKFIRDYIDRKRFDAEEYQQQLEEARAALQIEQRNLQRAEAIRSPSDGVVLARHNTRRQYLPAGTPLLTVGDLDQIEVIAEILTERAMQIRPADPVDVYGEGIPDGPLSGRVLRVYPAGFEEVSSLGVEQQRVKVAVKLDQRPARLGVAYRVHVRIYHDEAQDALTLPRTALFRSKEGTWQVMTVAEGTTRLQSVTVGLMNDRRAQIIDGLQADAHVLAQPAKDITAGMHVAIQQQH